MICFLSLTFLRFGSIINYPLQNKEAPSMRNVPHMTFKTFFLISEDNVSPKYVICAGLETSIAVDSQSCHVSVSPCQETACIFHGCIYIDKLVCRTRGL